MEDSVNLVNPSSLMLNGLGLGDAPLIGASASEVDPRHLKMVERVALQRIVPRLFEGGEGEIRGCASKGGRVLSALVVER